MDPDPKSSSDGSDGSLQTAKSRTRRYLIFNFAGDIENFRVRSKSIARVLVFPPVNNYHRFLIHKVQCEYVRSKTHKKFFKYIIGIFALVVVKTGFP
jgi:hypothetical protein